jgi:hypothetical protein
MKSMTYEELPLTKPSRSSTKKIALSELDKYSDGQMLWHIAKKRKFPIVVTLFILYVAFNSFGTLIVGLAESIK